MKEEVMVTTEQLEQLQYEDDIEATGDFPLRPDLSRREQKEAEFLRTKLNRTLNRRIDSEIPFIEKNYPHLLSNPKYIYENDWLCYVMTYRDDKIKIVQVAYYNYFVNRYPSCQFYCNDEKLNPIAIRLSGKIVGLVMPILSVGTLSELEEKM